MQASLLRDNNRFYFLYRVLLVQIQVRELISGVFLARMDIPI